MLFSVAALAVASTASLSLEIGSPKTTVLVGEPIKIVERFRVTGSNVPIVVGDPRFIRLFVDDGTGRREYRMYGENAGDGPVPTEPAPKVGATFVRNLIVAAGRYADEPRGAVNSAYPSTPLFRVAGQYRVSVAVVFQGAELARSGEVVFTATAPAAADQRVLAEIGRDYKVVLARDLTGTFQRLLAEQPDSPYLVWGRLKQAEFKAAQALNRQDPESGAWLLGEPKAAVDAMQRDVARRLLDSMSVEGGWGAFDEDRLWLATSCAAVLGDVGMREQLISRILTTYPDSATAWKIRQLRDQDPPKITASATPASLWPPDHRMVLVQVAATAIDDVDPRPSLVLKSITCDDGCDPGKDIAGAALGTDDREFTLRATRMGGGAGRAYTITYAAADAVGNESRETLVVRVPHDQGSH